MKSYMQSDKYILTVYGYGFDGNYTDFLKTDVWLRLMSRSAHDNCSDYKDGYHDVTVSCLGELPVCPMQNYITTWLHIPEYSSHHSFEQG